jgi:ABC-type nitrate/sulfonate/bicarbonate transport system substrate-binding protein
MNQIFVALVTIFVLHASVYAADKIKIGYPDASGTFLSLPLGQKTGSFQKEGIQADLIRIRSTVALTALVSGELDYHSVLGPAVAAAIRGVPVKIVACYTPRVATAIIALPEFKSVQDLRGKTIGINSLGGGLEGQARLMLKQFGLDAEKDVMLLATGGMESRLTAMKQGFTVATLGSPPHRVCRQETGVCCACQGPGTFQLPIERFDRQCQEDQRAAGRDQANDQSGHQNQPLYLSESRGHD